ncbi:MAG: hypothetical protein JNM39_09295 [Bdellovibrionaceae bacterium]|jgi:hypothetical protein|nr:hypothetical protein [Pseudobdellovibrionaceae bacterium]
MEIAFILGGLFLFCTIGFIAIALFIPELVGIQGRKAQEIEASQRGEAPLDLVANQTQTDENNRT